MTTLINTILEEEQIITTNWESQKVFLELEAMHVYQQFTSKISGTSNIIFQMTGECLKIVGQSSLLSWYCSNNVY